MDEEENFDLKFVNQKNFNDISQTLKLARDYSETFQRFASQSIKNKVSNYLYSIYFLIFNISI